MAETITKNEMQNNFDNFVKENTDDLKLSKQEKLALSSFQTQFKEMVSDGEKNENQDYSLDEFNKLLENFMISIEVVKNDDGSFVKFIESQRKAELKEFNRLAKLSDERTLTEEENIKMSETANAKALEADEYYMLNAFKYKNTENFISKEPEKSKVFLNDFFTDLSKSNKAINKSEKFKEMSPEEKKFAALMHTGKKRGLGFDELGASLKDFIKKQDIGDVALKGAQTVSYALNPAGLLVSKTVNFGLKKFFETETGKQVAGKAINNWENVFGKNKMSPKMKTAGKCLMAVGVLGAAVIGIDAGEVSDLLASINDAGMPGDFAIAQELGVDANSDVTMDDVKVLENPENPSFFKADIPNSLSVEAGNTLEGIAKSLLNDPNISAKELQEMTLKLAEFNGIENANHIFEGQKINIPTAEEFAGLIGAEPELDLSPEGLKNGFEIPYGANITPEELASKISESLTEMYPEGNEKDMALTMANIKSSLTAQGISTKEVIDSMTKLNVSESIMGLMENTGTVEVDLEPEHMTSDMQADMDSWGLEESLKQEINEKPEQPTSSPDKPKGRVNMGRIAK